MSESSSCTNSSGRSSLSPPSSSSIRNHSGKYTLRRPRSLKLSSKDDFELGMSRQQQFHLQLQLQQPQHPNILEKPMRRVRSDDSCDRVAAGVATELFPTLHQLSPSLNHQQQSQQQHRSSNHHTQQSQQLPLVLPAGLRQTAATTWVLPVEAGDRNSAFPKSVSCLLTGILPRGRTSMSRNSLSSVNSSGDGGSLLPGYVSSPLTPLITDFLLSSGPGSLILSPGGHFRHRSSLYPQPPSLSRIADTTLYFLWCLLRLLLLVGGVAGGIVVEATARSLRQALGALTRAPSWILSCILPQLLTELTEVF